MQLLAINSAALAETPTGSEHTQSQPESAVVPNGGYPQDHMRNCLRWVKKKKKKKGLYCGFVMRHKRKLNE